MRRLEQTIAEFPVASILGARQVGKSTLGEAIQAVALPDLEQELVSLR